MGHVGSKIRSLGEILEKPSARSRGHIFSLIFMKLGQNVCLDEISKLGHVGSKTRSLGQMLGKPCLLSRGHIVGPIIMKPGQNVCLDETLDDFKNWSCWVKNYVTSPYLTKTLHMLWGKHFQSDYHET